MQIPTSSSSFSNYRLTLSTCAHTSVHHRTCMQVVVTFTSMSL
uniref:Uncharacterized protein n=1 Tax=Setaria italica TaxID=4555 RepID=K3ZPG8_SETIT